MAFVRLPLRLAVLISGSGSTMVNLASQIEAGELNCAITLVIASRSDLAGIQRARVLKLPTVVIDPRESDGTAAFNRKVFAALDQAKVDLVCLGGWLCLLDIPPAYEGKILNIHPSLLPSFGGKGMYGLRVHQAVLDRGCTVSGCTVHIVDNMYDHGPIVLQRTCAVLKNDTAASLAARVFEQENIAYPEAIKMFEKRLAGDDSVPSSEAIGSMRKNYQAGELNEADVASDPITQFAKWFNDARGSKILEPTVMTLATANAEGKPSARIVLLKNCDAQGFVFYTNRNSQKGKELKENARASLVFFWDVLERQVRISGRVEQLTYEQSEIYFHSRPIGSQIGAWVSHQSSVILSRNELDQSELDLTAKFAGQQVPMPAHWGGYRVIPTEIEFWQGRPSRLHDRLRYRLHDTEWIVERLAP